MAFGPPAHPPTWHLDGSFARRPGPAPGALLAHPPPHRATALVPLECATCRAEPTEDLRPCPTCDGPLYRTVLLARVPRLEGGRAQARVSRSARSRATATAASGRPSTVRR